MLVCDVGRSNKLEGFGGPMRMGWWGCGGVEGSCVVVAVVGVAGGATEMPGAL